MDIARTPSTADGNPQLADAPPEPKEPAIIRRKDYRPFEWLVPETRLHFDLDANKTKVVSTLTVERNPAADASPTIRLNGDGLEPDWVEVDGEAVNSWTMDGDDLLVTLPGDSHTISIATTIDPSANSQLMGLFASGGILCTQCEAEGFRRITFFPDRPDVLSTYSVRMEASKADYPVLLANGNNTDSGESADGRHWAEWHDPWPKPSYLFALVAGDLVANRDSFTTMGGRTVDLAIFVREGDEGRTQHAMDSLKASMKWDEETFGREYDLDIYNIVAVSDFNMGAMENKGLNVFNTKYVLADVETATDGDFDAVEGVIAHEYFHNWSGNRITCRDWFQLSLKEGFTVLRDQLFSQDMNSEPVKRIEDVRVLRSIQFPEDSGPLAHPIRPDSYREISNFYTSTVYNKGAEVIRMMRTMAGPEKFRAGTDIYFDTHDGEAATCEDFVASIERGAGLDLTQFRRWYEQAGTPKVTVESRHEGSTYTLSLAQEVPPTPGQPDKKPMPIPLKIALFDKASGTHSGEQLVVLDEARQDFTFNGIDSPPVLSINRGFSAPVRIERDLSREELVFLAAQDDDAFARYEAMQELVVGHIVGVVTGKLSGTEEEKGREAIREATLSALTDEGLDDLMRGELLMLPGVTYLIEQVDAADPVALSDVREDLKAWLGRELASEFYRVYERAEAVPFSLEAEAKGARKLKTLVLTYLAASDPDKAAELAARQYDRADNMTDRQGALMVLTGLDTPERTGKLLEFYDRFKDNALVVDKWFALQATSLHPSVVEHVEALADHPQFTLKNPNRVRSLYMAFAGNPRGFHRADGAGYRMIADLILKLDPINAQTAARFVPALGRWKKVDPERSRLMRAELERVAAADKLSRDTYEQVQRSLG
ncbi:aminopeptidase N [Alteriqipengyuania flavescens]|uniref:aminopeptidase N n=1 Tax=Alteriqipengyuania flavescens TaxID=3053610 RepID=UPI0025B55563|nr:aminopeptidase N [Alteriqipengyuania flavescens]WJY19507.1 aminopeptidase N [Alteriqipengyuania flavescens]WJY25449.1 aminopeptidase N [Alteriqipengyuania flavescens]